MREPGLVLVPELVHSKVLELRSMVLELVRSSLTSLHATWKANPSAVAYELACNMDLVRSMELVRSMVLELARNMELVRSRSSSCGRDQRKRTRKN